jgi:hypothetical protein
MEWMPSLMGDCEKHSDFAQSAPVWEWIQYLMKECLHVVGCLRVVVPVMDVEIWGLR